MTIDVFVGTGGVGKTSLAAATALHAARNGRRALVLTIDPARRLRTALGLPLDAWEHRVAIDGGGPGELWAAVLDVAATLDRAVAQYGRPPQAATVLAHPIYHSIRGSLGGMQELMAIERLGQAVRAGFDAIIVDTAPSRHALEFLDKPELFLRVSQAPVVQMVGRAWRLLERSPLGLFSGQSLNLLARLEGLLGATFVRQVLDFHSVFHTIAEQYATEALRTSHHLRSASTTGFHIVTTPAKASSDAEYFLRELRTRRFPVASLTVNRVWPPDATARPADLSAEATAWMDWYDEVGAEHRAACERVTGTFGTTFSAIRQVPEFTDELDGLASLDRLADCL